MKLSALFLSLIILVLPGCFRTVSDIPAPSEGVTILGRMVKTDLSRVEKQPVANVSVSLSGRPQSLVTKEDGIFTFYRVPLGEIQLRVSQPNPAGRLRTLLRIDDILAVSDGQVLNLGDVELFGTGDIRGQVELVNANEASAEGALVAIVGTPYRAVVDKENGYRINDLPSGRIDVVTFKSGYVPGRLDGVLVQPNEISNIRPIQLVPGDTPNVVVDGKVFLSDNTPPGGVEVRFSSATSSVTKNLSATTDTDGLFRLELSVGIYSVTFRKEGYVPQLLSGVVVVNEGALGLRTVYLAPVDTSDSDQDGITDGEDPDDDNDGCLDEVDQFPNDPEVCVDSDGDGIGDALDDDDDNDGLTDAEEINVGIDGWITNPLLIDTDGDQVRDSEDLCPTIPDPSQTDTDNDGLGDACDPFTMAQPPVISDFFPKSGSVGTVVYIKGQNFNTSQPEFNAVVFGPDGGVAFPSGFSSEEGLVVRVPLGAKTGTISLYNAFGSATSTAVFSVYPKPIIYEVSPSTARPGQSVYVRGAHFSVSTPKLTIDGVQVPVDELRTENLTSLPPTEIIRFRLPQLGIGPVDVFVETEGGNDTSQDAIFVSGGPEILRVAPNPIARGAPLDIFGNNFTSTVQNAESIISFATSNSAGRAEAVAQRVAEGHLRVLVPQTAVTGQIALVYPEVTSTSAVELIVDTQLPSLTDIDKTLIQAGDTVVISGYSFQSPTAVRFEGVPGIIQSWTAGQVIATVPTTTIAGHIEVDFNLAGTGNFTARMPEPFHLIKTSTTPITFSSSFNRNFVLYNDLGTEIVTFGAGASQAQFIIRRYNANTFALLSESTLTMPNTLFPVSADLSPDGQFLFVSRIVQGTGATDTEEILFIPLTNPSAFQTCQGLRETATRLRDTVFHFDSRSEFAYAILPHGLSRDDTGVLRVNFTDRNNIVCDSIGILDASIGPGEIEAILLSEDDRSLWVFDSQRGLARLNVVETSTTFGTYSPWVSVTTANGTPFRANRLFFSREPGHVWLISTNQDTALVNVANGNILDSIFNVRRSTLSFVAQTFDRRWLAESPGSPRNEIKFVDLDHRLVSTTKTYTNTNDQQISSHPYLNRFLVKPAIFEVLQVEIISP